MRRRIKFVMSVASLTLAMFMAMFGVWAAATRQVAITGTITFTSENVLATITVYEFTSTASGTFSMPAQNKAEKQFTETNQDSLDVSLTPNLTDTDVKYTFIIKVVSGYTAGVASKIEATLVAPTVPGTATGWLTLKQQKLTTAPSAFPTAVTSIGGKTDIAAAGTVYYVFTYEANPASAPASATGLTFNSSLTLTKANA